MRGGGNGCSRIGNACFGELLSVEGILNSRAVVEAELFGVGFENGNDVEPDLGLVVVRIPSFDRLGDFLGVPVLAEPHQNLHGVKVMANLLIRRGARVQDRNDQEDEQ